MPLLINFGILAFHAYLTLQQEQQQHLIQENIAYEIEQ